MLLVTRPNHDNATNYLYFWSREVIDEANRRKVGVLDLSGKKANRKDFLSYVKKHNPRIFFFNGHGSETAICGYNNEVLIDTESNYINLGNSIVFSRSCKSASILGNFMVKNGLSVFLGYVNNFAVKISGRLITNPLKDKIASLYLEPSNLVVKVLLKGGTAEEANNRSKKMFLANLKNILASNSNDKEDIAHWLYHDYCSQVVIGDGKKVIGN